MQAIAKRGMMANTKYGMALLRNTAYVPMKIATPQPTGSKRPSHIINATAVTVKTKTIKLSMITGVHHAGPNPGRRQTSTHSPNSARRAMRFCRNGNRSMEAP